MVDGMLGMVEGNGYVARALTHWSWALRQHDTLDCR